MRTLQCYWGGRQSYKSGDHSNISVAAKKSNGNDDEDLWKTGAQMSDAFEFCDNVTVLTRIADVCV